ncbi:MAG: DUF2764 family protein [Bacteroidetes bacterium]|nr:DUF2764 family protein [Bacteroidota bacterium]
MNTKREYHYLVAGLPDIIIGQSKVSLKVAGFKEELRQFLHPEDFKLVEMLFLRFDNQNLLNLLQKKDEPWDVMGNFSPEQLQQGMEDPAIGLPAYMLVFYHAFREDTPIVNGMSWENQLTQVFFQHVIEHTEGFLKEWFTFDRDLKNLLAAISARRHGISLEGQLIGQNEVTSAIQKSHARDFGLLNEYPYIEKLLKVEEQTDILERERSITQLKWAQIEELNTFNYFTIDKILGFLLKLISFERWAALDAADGKDIFRQKIGAMEHSFDFSKEFQI